MQVYNIPAELASSTAAPVAKLIAVAMLNGILHPPSIQATFALDKRRYHENKDEGEALYHKFREDFRGTAVGPKQDFSRTFDQHHPAYQLDMVKTLNSGLTQTAEIVCQTAKEPDEKLALEVGSLNIQRKDSKKKKNIGGVFLAPTQEQVLAAFKELKPGHTELMYLYNATTFFFHYEKTGWTWGNGKNPLVRWRSAVGQWRMDQVPKAEEAAFAARLPKPPKPEPEDDHYDPFKNLIPEVDHPLFSQLPQWLQTLAHQANERFYHYNEEAYDAALEMIRNRKRTDAIEKLRIKHQWHKMDAVRWEVRLQIYKLQNPLALQA